MYHCYIYYLCDSGSSLCYSNRFTDKGCIIAIYIIYVTVAVVCVILAGLLIRGVSLLYIYYLCDSGSSLCYSNRFTDKGCIIAIYIIYVTVAVVGVILAGLLIRGVSLLYIVFM